MDKITAPLFRGVVGGGSAGHGQYAYLVIRLGEADQQMVVEKSMVGAFILGLVHAAGMARAERVASNPSELTGEGLDAAYALKVSSASVGRSSQPGHAVLNIEIDADEHGKMNLYLVADQASLSGLRATVDRASDALGAGDGAGARLLPN